MKNDKWLRIGIIIVAVILIFVGYKVFKAISDNNSRVDISGNDFYQYFSGIKNEYSGDMKILKHNDQKILILEDTSQVYLDATPMYYKNDLGKVLLPEEVEVVNPKTRVNQKLQAFSVLYKENEDIKVRKYKKDEGESLKDVFIYDGQDMYMFLEETTINVGGTEYVVSPLSYVYVTYRDYVEIYDYEKNEVTVLDNLKLENNVMANTGDYTIDMSVDSVNYEDVQQLLIKKLDYVQEMEY